MSMLWNPSSSAFWLLIIMIWVGLVVVYQGLILPRVKRGPGGRLSVFMLCILCRAFAKYRHKFVVVGTENIPLTNDPGGLIVVSNHTGSIDPLLIQITVPFHIRWMMARDQMWPAMDWLWKVQDIIAVERDGTDTAPTREAIRHVKEGGVLGIFPEGAIAFPSRELRPFHPGVGLLVARTKAPVLLCWVSGTPDTNDVATSLLASSRSRVHFLELIDFKGERDMAKIAKTLQDKIAKVSGWPENHEHMAPGRNDADPFLV
ncbi:MAG: lysophospholipid acyltransferase family protein [Planctomycetota bacterium]|nr:lysophospholipid acyltransferase family protein [Planctomycetota bacterium]